MADKLDQFLQPAERILYREPDGRGSGYGVFAHSIVAGVLGPIMSGAKGVFTTFLTMLLFLIANRGLASSHRPGMAEAAVTERRVVHVIGEGASFEFTEIMAEEVAAIEVLGAAVRVTRTDGKIVVLDRLQSAPQLGLALARAAGVSAPWVPGPREGLAEEAVIQAGFVGVALAYALTLGALDGRAEISSVLALIYAWLAGAVAWLPATLAGLWLVRQHLTRAEMRAWMRQCFLFAPKPQPGARSHRFARFCLWFVDLFGDPQAAPTHPPQR